MHITEQNFHSILQTKQTQIEQAYENANNASMAGIGADKTCIECIEKKSFQFINSNKTKKMIVIQII